MSTTYRGRGPDRNNSIDPAREPCDIMGVARCDTLERIETMKTINVNGTRFALPDTMSAKDVQSLVGFLATLQTVESYYNYDQSEYLYDLGRYPEVRLEDIELTDNAKGKSDLSYESYKARRDAEKAAA